jgi:glycerol-3-phosphate acyltransferase PlsY
MSTPSKPAFSHNKALFLNTSGKLFKYSSLAALTAATAIPVLAYYTCPLVYTYFYFAIAALVIIRHRQNIIRLLTGKESKIKLKK